MISFRYHLVSIIAVFLALALGIVVGATALNGPITKDLRRQVNDAKQQRDTLASQNKQLGTQVDDANQFASTYGDRLVAGTLTGSSILEVVLPDTPSTMVDGITQQLTSAGAKISGTVTVTDGYLDPTRGTGITSLATGPAR
ncbi:MAG: copper transporter, partial [Actinobacteria bacterium]|nr:copper transporter [Actinomycetota bacterium]